MKSFKLFVLLALSFIFFSCKREKDACADPYYDHYLWLSFQDEAGNDLVKGIGIYDPDAVITDETVVGLVQRDLYTLDIIFEEGVPNMWKLIPQPWFESDTKYPEVAFSKGKSDETIVKSDYDLLVFRTQSYREYFLIDPPYADTHPPFAEKIIFRLSCPYLFRNVLKTTYNIIL